MTKCKNCIDLYDTPIFFDLLQDWFKMDAKKVISIYHKKGHKIFE
jgi:hypothetical protein